MKKYTAEFIGTFVLSLIVGLSVAGTFSIPTPMLAGLTLGLFVYTIGALSGCHINPAITVGLLSIGKIDKPEAVKYVIAQILGAFMSAVVLVQLNASVPPIIAGGATQIVAELIGTAVLAFGVGAIVFGKVSDVASGLVIGGSLLLGISIAALMGSAGILNPAVSFTLNAFHPTYLLGQVFGSLIGFSLAKSLHA